MLEPARPIILLIKPAFAPVHHAPGTSELHIISGFVAALSNEYEQEIIYFISQIVSKPKS